VLLGFPGLITSVELQTREQLSLPQTTGCGHANLEIPQEIQQDSGAMASEALLGSWLKEEPLPDNPERQRVIHFYFLFSSDARTTGLGFWKELLYYHLRKVQDSRLVFHTCHLFSFDRGISLGVQTTTFLIFDLRQFWVWLGMLHFFSFCFSLSSPPLHCDWTSTGVCPTRDDPVWLTGCCNPPEPTTTVTVEKERKNFFFFFK